MTIHVGRLTLRLPAGYEERAMHIARQVGHSLSVIPAAGQCEISRLTADPIEFDHGASDADLVQRISAAISSKIIESKRS